MRISLLALTFWSVQSQCEVLDRQPLSYAPISENAYVAPKPQSQKTLLELIQAREELSTLSSMITKISGFSQAFDTPATWQYTFFAPSNEAFNNTGQYFKTNANTAKGAWWIGNLLQHHYIPNTRLNTSQFSEEDTRFQTGTFLYVSAKKINGGILLNDVSTVTEGDIDVTNGLVHIIDHFLDPSAQIFQPDLQKSSQNFIPGSCSNTQLPYC